MGIVAGVTFGIAFSQVQNIPHAFFSVKFPLPDSVQELFYL